MFMHHAGPFGYFPLGLLGGLAALLFLAGVVLLIIWLVRAMSGPNSVRPGYTTPPPAAPESPLDILRRRFAAGEISADEFQKARDLLNDNPKP
jgi:putative membrane protein